MKVAFALSLLLAAAAAQTPSWKIWDNDLDLTTCLGVAFTSPLHGYTAGTANGAGDEIYVTEDGGKTFTLASAKFGTDLLLLDMAAQGETAIVSGVIGELYTLNNGKSFQPSVGGGVSQNCMPIRGSGGLSYGCVGTFGFGKIDGAAVTHDGGVTFSAVNASALTTEARYGAFPSKSVWYIAAGDFPSAPSPPPPANGAPRRPRKSVFQDHQTGRFSVNRSDTHITSQTDGYNAQIVKTEDGGKTWVSQFSNTGSYYMNGIDCSPTDPNHCCAVAEGSSSSEPGARIFCTTDGKTWNQNFMKASTSSEEYSLMRVQFVSDTLIWAVGGDLKRIAPSAWFLKSTDGGKTWVPEAKEFPGWYALGISMVNANIGYAAMDNLITQHSAIGKYTQEPAPPPSPSPSPPPPPGPSPPPSPGPSPPPSPGGGHYEDPNTTGACRSDEEDITITGLAGKFCSPSCSASSPCPSDVPAGTTARPQCVLEKQGSSQPTNCALICNPTAKPDQCPTKASCKAIQTTGVCTYDS